MSVLTWKGWELSRAVCSWWLSSSSLLNFPGGQDMEMEIMIVKDNFLSLYEGKCHGDRASDCIFHCTVEKLGAVTLFLLALEDWMVNT